MPLNASNSARTLGTGKPQPGFWWAGWPNARSLAGVSGAIVEEPSTSSTRSPHQRDDDEAAAPAAAVSRSSARSTSSGSRIRASQYAAALTAWPARWRRCRMAVLKWITCRTNRCTVSTGPNCRSRHSCPAARQARRIDSSDTNARTSSLIRANARAILAIPWPPVGW